MTPKRSATLKLSEKGVTKQCVDFCRLHGWKCIRLQSGLFTRPLSQARVRIGEPGMPDWVFMRHWQRSGLCQVMFLEFKATGKIPTPAQEHWARLAKIDGFTIAAFDSFTEFEKFYQAHYEGIV